MSPLQKHNSNPGSLRLAINASCYQCQGEDSDPCFQWRIGNCEIATCGLFTVRPYKNMEGRPIPASLSSE